MAKLYTGTGDQGYTQLLGAERVPKYDLRPEAYGTVDEASAVLGLVRAEPTAADRTTELVLTVQHDLWVLMGELAAAPDAPLPRRISAGRVEWLETETTRLGEEFPPLKGFVIPGNTPASAYLEVARTVVRRAERHITRLVHEGYLENEQVLRYVNRLSSLLFALARYEEHRQGGQPTYAKDVQ